MSGFALWDYRRIPPQAVLILAQKYEFPTAPALGGPDRPAALDSSWVAELHFTLV
jgi:hypothetical protein